MKIKTEVFHGQTVEIEVDSRGFFTAEVGEEREVLSGSTLEELETKLRRRCAKLAKREPIEISILGATFGKKPKSWVGAANEVYEAEGQILDCILRGANPRTRQLLLTIGKHKIQWDRGYGDNNHPFVTKRLSDADKSEWRRLESEARSSAAMLEAFELARKINPRKLDEKDEDE
jgi:hypothetical protein